MAFLLRAVILALLLVTYNAEAFSTHRRSGINSNTPQAERSGRARHLLHMGMQVHIRIVGRKNSEQWLEDAYEMYETRLRPSSVQVATTWHKDNPALIKGVSADESKGHKIVLLDPLGASKTSEVFSENMYDWLMEGGSRLSFVIGGAEGLPPELKYAQGGKKKSTTMSLSALTFTHQFARVLLIEQIYRATEIRKGSGYHK